MQSMQLQWISGLQSISWNPDGDFTILDQPLAAEQYAVGFKKGNETLRDQVQNTLNEMKSDGTFKTIAEKWDLQDSVILD